MPKDTSWGAVSEWYDSYLESEEDSYQKKVILPNLLRLMDIKKGQAILDLACGSGFFTREFQKAGARVIGSDISKELLKIAARDSDKSITYVQAPAEKLPFQREQFDSISLVLALQNIRGVKESIEECNRVLKSKGRFFTVLNHPAFRMPKGSSWGFNTKDGKMYRRIDYYMKEAEVPISMHPGEGKKETTVSFHRPLQYYTKFFSKSGFVITRLEEWISHKKSEPGPRQKEEDRIRKEIPLFLALELTKL
ncbi:methyltransferase domain-containing protein [Candidatus Parcubacteria bacterium]|nr:methyltransferase domain-containing protein [Candidatus Parcubacteria bacterium]